MGGGQRSAHQHPPSRRLPQPGRRGTCTAGWRANWRPPCAKRSAVAGLQPGGTHAPYLSSFSRLPHITAIHVARGWGICNAPSCSPISSLSRVLGLRGPGSCSCSTVASWHRDLRWLPPVTSRRSVANLTGRDRIGDCEAGRGPRGRADGADGQAAVVVWRDMAKPGEGVGWQGAAAAATSPGPSIVECMWCRRREGCAAISHLCREASAFLDSRLFAASAVCRCRCCLPAPPPPSFFCRCGRPSLFPGSFSRSAASARPLDPPRQLLSAGRGAAIWPPLSAVAVAASSLVSAGSRTRRSIDWAGHCFSASAGRCQFHLHLGARACSREPQRAAPWVRPGCWGPPGSLSTATLPKDGPFARGETLPLPRRRRQQPPLKRLSRCCPRGCGTSTSTSTSSISSTASADANLQLNARSRPARPTQEAAAGRRRPTAGTTGHPSARRPAAALAPQATQATQATALDFDFDLGDLDISLPQLHPLPPLSPPLPGRPNSHNSIASSSAWPLPSHPPYVVTAARKSAARPPFDPVPTPPRSTLTTTTTLLQRQRSSPPKRSQSTHPPLPHHPSDYFTQQLQRRPPSSCPPQLQAPTTAPLSRWSLISRLFPYYQQEQQKEQQQQDQLRQQRNPYLTRTRDSSPRPSASRLWNPQNSLPRNFTVPAVPAVPNIPVQHASLTSGRPTTAGATDTSRDEHPLLTLPEQRRNQASLRTPSSLAVERSSGDFSSVQSVGLPKERHGFRFRSGDRRPAPAARADQFEMASLGSAPNKAPRSPEPAVFAGPTDPEAARRMARSPSRASVPGLSQMPGDVPAMPTDDEPEEEEFSWGPSHPCYPHMNTHVPVNSPLYETTRIIKIRRDWMQVGDLAPTFANLYPEILDPLISEEEFRNVIRHINTELVASFTPWSVRAWADAMLGAATLWLYDDLGLPAVKRRLKKLEKWIEDWNKGVGQREGVQIIPLRRTGYMTVSPTINAPPRRYTLLTVVLQIDFQIPDPRISMDTSTVHGATRPSMSASANYLGSSNANLGDVGPYPVPSVADAPPNAHTNLPTGVSAR